MIDSAGACTSGKSGGGEGTPYLEGRKPLTPRDAFRGTHLPSGSRWPLFPVCF